MNLLLAAAIGIHAWAQTPTGPEVGQRIPAFEATDQNGVRQTLETLAGPNGLVLLFVRSADW